MTVRMASCRELSEDGEAIARLAKYISEIENTETPTTVLLPWFPGPSKRRKKKATQALYNLILSYIELRRKSSAPSNDPIDLFISLGLSDDSIIQVRPSQLPTLHDISFNVEIDHHEYHLCWSG